MMTGNGSVPSGTLRDALASAGFARSETFSDEPWLAPKEKLYVLVRPDDAVYAHVRVDGSDERPKVREIVLSTELRGFYGTHDPAVTFTRYPDDVSVVSARYPQGMRASDPSRTVHDYLEVIASADPVPRWTHLAGHRELSQRLGSNAAVRIAPWIEQLPAEHRELFGYRAPRFTLFRSLLDYRSAF
jgi:hypothetical protein